MGLFWKYSVLLQGRGFLVRRGYGNVLHGYGEHIWGCLQGYIIQKNGNMVAVVVMS